MKTHEQLTDRELILSPYIRDLCQRGSVRKNWSRKAELAILTVEIVSIIKTDSIYAAVLDAELLSKFVEIILRSSNEADAYLEYVNGFSSRLVFGLNGGELQLNACEAALGIRNAVVKLNEETADCSLNIRLGVSDSIMDYGIFGIDTSKAFIVNGSAIAQSLFLTNICREYGVNIIVDDLIEAKTRDHYEYRELDTYRIKGAQKRDIFELVDSK